MISHAAHGAASIAARPVQVNVSPAATASSALSSQSFQSELQQAFASALKQVGLDPSTIQLTFGSNSGSSSGQNNGAVQNTGRQSSVALSSVGVSGLSALFGGSSATASSAANPGVSSAISATSSSAPVSTQQASSQQPSLPFGSQPTFFAQNAETDAYWSAQPAAVQQLAYISDQGQRASLAAQLASEGYQVDVPIMVWGWDPSITMAMRRQDGYTWVPSALQRPVEMAPGLTAPGGTPYDPNNPPPGSIEVT